MKKPSNLTISNKDALIVADIQIDFLPGGALPVAEGDLIIPALNDYARIFRRERATIIASRDWHPANHISFKARGGPWPPHCVQQTEGAKFSAQLKLPEGTTIVSKATDPNKEAYSVFDGTGLAEKLTGAGITRVFIGGVATDYCVVNSALDATRLGFATVILMDAVKGIEVTPGDVDKAISNMIKNGAQQVTLEDFPEPLVVEEVPADTAADKPLGKVDIKRKARMRSKGSYKRVRRERQ